MTVIARQISEAEAMEFIQNDMLSLSKSHHGFLSNPERPFRAPVHLPDGLIVWPPVDIHPAAKIGHDVVIGRYTNICGDIEIGNNVRIQGFCFIPDCIKIESNVFIGPNVVFTNVKYPQVRFGAGKIRDGKTIVKDGASIGAGAIICPGIIIGERSLVGAGAVVTKDVLPDSVVVGCPAVTYQKKE